MILVTGATGQIGANLAIQLLEKEPSIRAIFRNSENQQKTKQLFELHKKKDLYHKIEWIQADILDITALQKAFKNITYVYHCAALISFDPSDEEKLRKTNIEGTANMVNLCIDNNINKLCYVSSIAALGDKKEHEKYIDEATEWNPEINHSDYAISKYGAEMEVWRGYQEGLPVVIVNPGVVLGTSFLQTGSNQIFSIVKNKLRFYTKGTTGFVGVSDLVNIMQKLMQSTISGERFCVVSENKNFQELTTTIADNYKVAKPSLYLSKNATLILSFLDSIFSFLKIKKSILSKQVATSLHTLDLYSNNKITTELNFSFAPVSEVVASSIHINKSI